MTPEKSVFQLAPASLEKQESFFWWIVAADRCNLSAQP